MGLALLDRLQHWAAVRGDAEAVRVIGGEADPSPPLTFAQLDRRVRRVADRLDRDPRTPADATLMLLSTNRPAVVPAFLGTLAAGRSLFPVDAALTAHELRRLADRSGAQAVILDPAHHAQELDLPVINLDALTAEDDREAEPTPADRGADAWLLLQSSGTTGGPKIVRRSGPSLDAVARNVAEAVGLRGDDRVVAAVPLSHSYGIENGMLAPLWAGATALHHVVPPGQPGRGFDPTLAVTSGATVLPGVPAMFEMIERMGAGRGRLRLAYSAGAPLPRALADRLEARDGLRLGVLYGSTEIGSVTFGPDPAGVGRPMRGVEVRILDPDHPDPSRPLPLGQVGHVAVRAPSMYAGYHAAPQEDADALIDGFFLTGDLGRLDADHTLTITGRLKLLIDIGGIKVNPLEVEQQLLDHPDVAECVVVPDPVSPTISRVKAILTAADPALDLDPTALRRYLRPRLAGHKIPRTFEVRPALPKTATGKVLRRQLLPRRASA